jgi:hypothetical protein
MLLENEIEKIFAVKLYTSNINIMLRLISLKKLEDFSYVV